MNGNNGYGKVSSVDHDHSHSHAHAHQGDCCDHDHSHDHASIRAHSPMNTASASEETGSVQKAESEDTTEPVNVRRR
jgi:ABC-type Zn2+ transport system substrate-binding protein/surface adhesin